MAAGAEGLMEGNRGQLAVFAFTVRKQRVNREWGSLEEDASSHQGPTPSSQVPHPKSFTTFSHILVAGDRLFKHRSLLQTAQLAFKL